MLFHLANIREFLINNFYSKIIGVEYNDKFYNNKNLLWIINLFFFPLTKSFFKSLNINYLFEKDNIIFYSKENTIKLGPVLFEFIVNNQDIKEIIDKYDNNVPINLIFKNENLKVEDSDEIFIKCFSNGIKSKKFNYKLIKFNLKIQLLFLI